MVSLAEATAELVHDGDVVALEGFTHLIPFAAGHELIRQRRRGLTLVRMTPDIIYDQLIGAGCADQLVFSWGGNPGVGSLHRFRDAVEHGWPAPLALQEHSHAGMAAAYAAGAARLPFAALRGYAGTGLPQVTATISTVTCPFTGEILAAVPALRPDVGDHPRAAGRRRGQRAALGHQRGAEGGGARLRAVHRHCRRGRSAARAPPRYRRAAVLGDHRGGSRPGWGTSVLRPRLLREGQRRSTVAGTVSAATARASPAGCRRTCTTRPTPRVIAALSSSSGEAEGRRARRYSTDEMMAVAAARHVNDGTVCFVGIGLPSEAANLARATHAPSCVLIYESGTIGAKPTRLPLSIGDGELAETADAVVSVPEIFSYWLQGGRINLGFLGAAQIDRFGNINTTVVGGYEHPAVRLPGAGGAPEIASSCRETFVMLRQTPRTFVQALDFRTSVGFGEGPGSRERLGLTGAGVSGGGDRPRHPRARRRDVRAGADPPPPRQHGRRRARGHRMAAARVRCGAHHRSADRRRARSTAQAALPRRGKDRSP